MTQNESNAPASNGSVADATARNWVDRYAPVRTRPYLRLSRADRPIGTWLLLIPCYWSLALAGIADPNGLGIYDLWLAVAFGIGAFLMRGAGCTWNDITDRDFDGRVERTRSRPIPSGQVSVKQAVMWMLVQTGISAALLLTFNWFGVLMAFVSLGPVLIYPFMKRFTWWPQFFLGIAFNWGALMGWACHFGGLDWPPVLLYIAGICWTLFYDTIYAHQDKEDDMMIGIKSTARLFGTKTREWLTAFLAVSCLLTLFAGLLAMEGTHPVALIAIIAGIWGFGWRMHWQLQRLDIDDPDICLRLFRDTRNVGFLLLAGWLIAAAF